MLVIAGHIRIDPANREAAVAAAAEVMEETHKEPGCISYTFSGAIDDEALFHLFEEWESQEALDAHFKTPHMAKFQSAMGGFGVKEIKIQRYEVSAVSKLMG